MSRYVGVVISNVVGGCPVSSGVVKAAGVRRVSGSGKASAGYYPPGHRKRSVEDNRDRTRTKPSTAPRRHLGADNFLGLKTSFMGIE